MRKCELILISVFLTTSVVNAKCEINKTKYNYKVYNYDAGDPYNPGVAGFTSFLIPGLGQMISGAGRRGAAFLGGFIGSLGIFVIGVAISGSNMGENDDGPSGAGAMLLGLTGAVVVDIWAIVDAGHAAKVNNLALRDKNKTCYNIQLQPYINTSAYKYSGHIPVGLTFKVAF